MKYLTFFKITALVFYFFSNPAGAMDQPIEEKLTSNICPAKIKSPTTWCVQEIEKQLRKDPFIVLEKKEILLQTLTEKARELQFNHLTPEKINEILSTYQLGCNQQEDPPFFRLKVGEKDIYILGSKHTIPMFKCLNLPTLFEIKKIASLKPILYIEHEITNEDAISALKIPSNQIDNISLKYGIDFFAKIGGSKSSDLNIEFRECIKEKPLFLSIGKESDIKLSEVSKAHTWLGAVLLGVHANILSFEKFGGIECELMQEPFWNTRWQKISVLETNQKILTTQKQNEKEDTDHNKRWATKSMTSIINFMKCDDDKLEEITKTNWKQLLDTYSHEIINFSTTGNTTQSGIVRNSEWSKRLADIMNDEQYTTPLFLVIGDAHLVGHKEDKSFLSFLIQNSKLKPFLSRFSNQQGWISID